MQYCFFRKQHYFVTEIVCFVAEKSFCINEKALPALEQHCFGSMQHCFGSMQHCFGSMQHCFFTKQSCFVTKILWSVTVKPISEAGQPRFLPETPISVTETLGSGTDSTVSEAHPLDFVME